MRILVITPRRRLSELLTQQLSAEGYEVSVCETGLAALRMLTTTRYRSILLDWTMQDISGLGVLRELRTRGIDAPVMVLSLASAVEDRVLALDSGADDFLAIPYHPQELAARVRRMLRSYPQISECSAPEIYCLADLTVDCDRQLVTRSGKRLMLSQKEYAVLECLIRNQGTAMTAADIEAQIRPRVGAAGTVISVYIHYLRRKLDHGFSVKLLHTIRKGGYVLRVDPRHTPA